MTRVRKREKYTRQACERCRTKKLKCLNSGPGTPCERCILAGFECQYNSNRRRKRHPEVESEKDRTTKTPAARKTKKRKISEIVPEEHELHDCTNGHSSSLHNSSTASRRSKRRRKISASSFSIDTSAASSIDGDGASATRLLSVATPEKPHPDGISPATPLVSEPSSNVSNSTSHAGCYKIGESRLRSSTARASLYASDGKEKMTTSRLRIKVPGEFNTQADACEGTDAPSLSSFQEGQRKLSKLVSLLYRSSDSETSAIDSNKSVAAHKAPQVLAQNSRGIMDSAMKLLGPSPVSFSDSAAYQFPQPPSAGAQSMCSSQSPSRSEEILKKENFNHSHSVKYVPNLSLTCHGDILQKYPLLSFASNTETKPHEQSTFMWKVDDSNNANEEESTGLRDFETLHQDQHSSEHQIKGTVGAFQSSFLGLPMENQASHEDSKRNPAFNSHGAACFLFSNSVQHQKNPFADLDISSPLLSSPVLNMSLWDDCVSNVEENSAVSTPLSAPASQTCSESVFQETRRDNSSSPPVAVGTNSRSFNRSSKQLQRELHEGVHAEKSTPRFHMHPLSQHFMNRLKSQLLQGIPEEERITVMKEISGMLLSELHNSGSSM